MKRALVYLTSGILFLLLTGCSQSTLSIDQRWASVQGGQIEKSQPGEEFYFTVPIDPSMLEPETVPVHIQVSGSVSRGALRFELRDPGGRPVWNSGEIGAGGFSMTTDYLPDPPRTGEYKLGLVYAGGTSAQYDLAWRALKIGPAVLLPGIGMLLVALGFVVFGARRYAWKGLEWRYFILGALLWAVTVAVKFAFAIPVSPLVYQVLKVSQEALFAPGNVAAYVYIGALTGIFEAGLAWLFLRQRGSWRGIRRDIRGQGFLPKRPWGQGTWSQALACGIGFGVIEALLLGLSSLGAGLAALSAPGALPVPTLASLARQATLVMATAPVVERLFVVLAHIFACTLLFYAITTGELRWVLLAILYKTVLDAPAGFAAFWGTTSPEKLWSIEAAVVVVGLAGLWGLGWIARKYPEEIGA